MLSCPQQLIMFILMFIKIQLAFSRAWIRPRPPSSRLGPSRATSTLISAAPLPAPGMVDPDSNLGQTGLNQYIFVSLTSLSLALTISPFYVPRRGVMIPALDPAPESDSWPFWDSDSNSGSRIVEIRIHFGSGSTSGS